MGRAGSGGGGRSSGGGHSSGRTGGGHRVSSGGSRTGSRSRAGSGSSGNVSRGGGIGGGPRGTGPRGPIGGGPRGPIGGGPRGTGPRGPIGGGPRGPIGGGPRGPIGGGPGMPPPPPPRRYRYGGYRGGHGGGCSTSVIILLIVIILAFAAFKSCAVEIGSTVGYFGSSHSGGQSSTIVREKLDTDNAYINDCVIDELGWFDNVSKTESQLKEFWEETGIQPYIILRDYDESLATDSDKEQWAIDYYDENFETENIFLFVYFAEEDTDNDVGYMAYANGYQTSSVMDSEAVEIFWNNIDKYWYTDLSTDNVFIKAFGDTADTIMHVSTTGKDLLKWALIVIAIILLGVIIIKVIKQRNQRAKEKAQEDQRILNTPINDIAKDNMEDKYL